MNEATGEILDPELASHGYQLWTAAVGTIIEAQEREVDDVVLMIHHFMPRDRDAAEASGDRRDWGVALAANQLAFHSFASAFDSAGGRSHETEFVRPGTKLDVIKVESLIDS